MGGHGGSPSRLRAFSKQTKALLYSLKGLEGPGPTSCTCWPSRVFIRLGRQRWERREPGSHSLLETSAGHPLFAFHFQQVFTAECSLPALLLSQPQALHRHGNNLYLLAFAALFFLKGPLFFIYLFHLLRCTAPLLCAQALCLFHPGSRSGGTRANSKQFQGWSAAFSGVQVFTPVTRPSAVRDPGLLQLGTLAPNKTGR